MNRSLYVKAAVTATWLIALSACVDDGYDLSNIDTTSRFRVDELVIPMNLDAITLNSVIEIDEESKIQIYTAPDGSKYYAVNESGSFNSNPIHVDVIECAAPALETKTIQISSVPAALAKNAAASGSSMQYSIESTTTDFTYDITGVDEAVHAVTSIRVTPMLFRIHLSAPDFGGTVTSVEFTNLKLFLPKGLEATASAGNYDAATGVLSVPHLVSPGASATIDLMATSIDMAANGAVLDYQTHELKFKSAMTVSEGILTLTAQNGMSLPSQIDFSVSYTLSDIHATNFSGAIEYLITGVNIEDVDLSDMPDFLSGEETNISLVNPQIYLGLNNPVGPEKLDCNTGLTLTAIRDGQPTGEYSIDNPWFTIGHGQAYGPYHFCLSPAMPSDPLPGYAGNLEHVGFKSLSDVLSGNGLPTSLGVRLNNPCIPLQNVADFSLGTDIPGIDGHYDFFAPLALQNGSSIVYTETEDGWNDEDVDAITVEKLYVSARATSRVPLDVKLSAYVLDKYGNRMQAQLTSVTLPANAEDFPFTIELTEGQTVTHLDGITFTARVNADGETPLSPDQDIVLKEVRAKVSGYYEKEL